MLVFTRCMDAGCALWHLIDASPAAEQSACPAQEVTVYFITDAHLYGLRLAAEQVIVPHRR